MTPDPTDAELDENIDRLKKRLNYGKDEADLDGLGELLEAYEALRACRQQSKAKDAVAEKIRKHCNCTKGVFQGMKAIRATLAAAPEPPG